MSFIRWLKRLFRDDDPPSDQPYRPPLYADEIARQGDRRDTAGTITVLRFGK